MNTSNEEGKITNLEYLTQLSKGNKTFVKEMIDIFLQENPVELKALEKEIADGNYAVIKATAHKLKSTFPFVGLDRIIEKDVEELESLAAVKGDIYEIRKRFLKIEEMCEKACLELKPANSDSNRS
ncbi:MAG: Hpt domain-containing protein [Bacteroidia bacterium]